MLKIRYAGYNYIFHFHTLYIYPHKIALAQLCHAENQYIFVPINDRMHIQMIVQSYS